MHREDLGILIHISDGKNNFELTPADLPYAIGLSPEGGLLAGTAAEPNVSLWLRNHNNRFYLQPEPGGFPARHNGDPIEGSVWLAVGDRIELGEITIAVNEEGRALSLAVADSDYGEPPSREDSVTSIQGNRTVGGSEAPAALTPRRKIAFSRPRRYLAGVFGILALGVGFVLAASPVTVTIEPSPSSVSLTGLLPPIPVGDRYLALPGSYTVKASQPGYRLLKEDVVVRFGETHNFSLRMRKLPGLLSVVTKPDLSAELQVDGNPAGRTPMKDLELDPGRHTISIISERYLETERRIDIVGKGERQKLVVRLQPAWGTVRVNTDPAGADLRLNDSLIGATPQIAKPVRGKYRLELSKEGWKPVIREFDIRPSQTVDFGTIRLERIDGKLALTTRPTDATVMIDGSFRGRTPVKIDLVSKKTYRIGLTKPGYARKEIIATIKPNETTTVSAELSPEFGVVFLKTRPSGASLKVEGQARGPASQRLRLPTRRHVIEVSKPGYITYKGSIRPRKGTSTRLNVTLKRAADVLRENSRRSVETRLGDKIRIVPIDGAVRFNMGASRREAGRRSNEALYPVELTKSYVIGETEVTNTQYRRFREKHNSGTGLNGDLQPVVSVTWDDAARYLNWLSQQENLPPAYREEGKRMVPIAPLTEGYRLPTEAEWAFAARYEAGKRPASRPLKYPWGPSMPPSTGSGNFADDDAAGLVPILIRGYSDGFRRTAPVGSFPANAHGIRDLGGNAAEWVNDFYDASTGGQKLARDPTGPATGRFHVVRGSSWRHGSITELRLSFRDFSDSKRNDIGFRIARYVQASK